MTTAERMKLMGQRNDSRLDMLVPADLKQLVEQHAAETNMPISMWVKMAIIEKAEREDVQSK